MSNQKSMRQEVGFELCFELHVPSLWDLTYLNYGVPSYWSHPASHIFHWQHSYTLWMVSLPHFSVEWQKRTNPHHFVPNHCSLWRLCALVLYLQSSIILPSQAFNYIEEKYFDRTAAGSVPNITSYGHLFTSEWRALFLNNCKPLCPLRVIVVFHQSLRHIFLTFFTWLHSDFSLIILIK